MRETELLLDERVAELEAEIERLRERYDFQVAANRSLVEACAKSEDEIERLRAMMQMPPPKGKFYCHPDDLPYWTGMGDEIEKLRARNADLEEQILRALGERR